MLLRIHPNGTIETLYDESLDLAELNPILDDRGKSARALVELVASLFGRKIMDRSPADRQT